MRPFKTAGHRSALASGNHAGMDAGRVRSFAICRRAGAQPSHTGIRFRQPDRAVFSHGRLIAISSTIFPFAEGSDGFRLTLEIAFFLVEFPRASKRIGCREGRQREDKRCEECKAMFQHCGSMPAVGRRAKSYHNAKVSEVCGARPLGARSGYCNRLGNADPLLMCR